MPARSTFLLLGTLALGAALVPACSPSSSQSSAPPDTTTAEANARAAPDSSTEQTATPPPSPTEDTDGNRSVAQRLADAGVAARAKRALARHRTLRRFDFSPSVVGGRLILRGNVDTRAQYREAERVVSALGEVTAVRNEVTVDGRPVASGTGEASPSETTYHTVRRGDTLSEIARRYGVSVRQLRSLNDLSSSLRPGERIRVR